MQLPSDSRHAVSRRRALRRRIGAEGALAVTLAGCGASDAAVFDAPAVVSSAPSDVAAATSPSPTSPSPTSPSPTSPSETADAATFPAGGELIVSFTYAASGGGRIRNPYTAVWVEDVSGNLVRTIAVTITQDKRRWDNHLRQWNSIDGDVTTSSATRGPGDYVFSWDGVDDAGGVVPAGEYTLFVEAAREDGPYSLISRDITVAGDGFATIDLGSDGEIVAATAQLRA